MIAFDADVLIDVFAGNVQYIARASTIAADEQSAPVIVIEEILRGRLNGIRFAEAGRGKIDLPQAYEYLKTTVRHLQELAVLSYTQQANDLFNGWRKAKIRVRTHDLRIAAICVAHSATLVTRNRRDFEQVPNLDLEVWE